MSPDIQIVFAGTDKGLFQSNGKGASWTQPNEYKGIAVLALAFDVDGNLYASTEESGLAKSSDLGKSWESINRPPDILTATSIAVDSQNKKIYVAGFAVPRGYQAVYMSMSVSCVSCLTFLCNSFNSLICSSLWADPILSNRY